MGITALKVEDLADIAEPKVRRFQDNVKTFARDVLNALADKPYIRVSLSASQTIADGAVAAVNFNAIDGRGGASQIQQISESKFQVPISGLYLVTYHVGWGANATGGRYAKLVVNGVTAPKMIRAKSEVPVSSGTRQTHHGTGVQIELAARDYLELYVNQNSGGNLTILGGDTTSEAATHMEISLLQAVS